MFALIDDIIGKSTTYSIKLIYRFMSLFSWLLQQSFIEIQASSLKMFWSNIMTKSIMIHHASSYQIWFKGTRIDWRILTQLGKSLNHWSQVKISLNYQYLEVVMVDMVSNSHPQQLLFTRQKYLAKKIWQNWKRFPKHFVALRASGLKL